MAVVATAGHVDHGKSTLVRALTGIEPDRFAEERRRGMTLDLGFAWTTLPSGRGVAFVDVPGHERFVPTMLAGVGPVPAVMFVVAADEGWMPQSAEHLDAVSALNVRHALLVVTRVDLAAPGPATAEARAALARTGLVDVPAVAVSARTGGGLPALRVALDELVGGLPEPLLGAPVRFWVDRAFSVRGAGTVVTGTLAAGTVRAGDELVVAPTGRTVSVRAVQSAGVEVAVGTPVSRVALNLRGVAPDEVDRGHALLTPDAWTLAAVVDVRFDRVVPGRLPTDLVLHAGAAAVPARVRPLGSDLGRVTLARPLPWHVGDRVLLRDPGAHAVVAGLTVLDPLPPPLRRRGAAAGRAAALAPTTGPDRTDEVRRRGLVSSATLRRLGVASAADDETAPGWHLSPARRSALAAALLDLVRAAGGVADGIGLDEACDRLDLPERALVRAVVAPPLEVAAGRVRLVGAGLPAALVDAVASVLDPERPFAAPEAGRLTAAALGPRELAAAVRAGLLDRVAAGVYLAPGARAAAAGALAALPSPFTVAEAKGAWATTRRVAVPLLEQLAADGVTVRTADGRHRLR